MMIEKEALLSKFDPDGRNLNPIEIRSIIVQAPTVDAVPVVRCGECEWWKNDGVHIYGMCKNPNTGSVKMDTDFCSFSVRKDDVFDA